MNARLAALTVVIAGCVPSLPTLVARHQYREALCAARIEGAGSAGEARVLDMLTTELAPAVHLRALTRDELTGTWGDAGARLATAYDMVLVTTSIRGSRFGDAFTVRFVDATTAPSNRIALAGVTGETLPGSRRVTSGAGVVERVVAAGRSPFAMLAGIGEAATLGMVPMLEMFGFVRPTTTTVYAPGDEEYRRSAPVAQAVFELLSDQRNYQRGLHRHGVVLVRHGAGPSSVVIETRFAAYGDGVTCALGERYTVPLTDGADLAARLSARFGGAVVPLRSLPGTRETLRP